MPPSISRLLKSAQFGGGRWLQATQVLRQVLGLGKTPRASPGDAAARRAPSMGTEALARGDAIVVDLPLREKPAPSANDAAFAAGPLRAFEREPQGEPGATPPLPSLRQHTPDSVEVADVPLPQARAPATQPAATPRPATFNRHSFQFDKTPYAYRVYLPAAADAAAPAGPLPLLVMLHGCKQDAADFAQGTAMNELAGQHGCIVLYPEQQAKANAMRCWNWFDTAHQGRDAGEPGMLAALTRKVIKRHNADPARVYIAGLSAGGAMAALMAGLYPKLFAAVGVHSGIPMGAASGVISALSVMRRGARPAALTEEPENVMPTIVFHGGADRTVHPENGEQIINAALAALNASGVVLQKTEVAEDGLARAADAADNRDASRTVYRAADGKPYVEYWEVGSGPHAWSGGNPAGSFTDPQGPDASQAMLAFFLQHRKAQG